MLDKGTVACREELEGVSSILRYLVRANISTEDLRGSTPLSSVLVLHLTCLHQLASMTSLPLADINTSISMSMRGLPRCSQLCTTLRLFAVCCTLSHSVAFDSLSAMQVDEWLDFAPQLASGAGLEAACAAVNVYLALRTFLVDYRMTAADVACWGQLEGKQFALRPTSVRLCSSQMCFGHHTPQWLQTMQHTTLSASCLGHCYKMNKCMCTRFL